MPSKRSLVSRIGMFWAMVINTWGQLGVIAGIFNTLVLISVLYSTWLKDLLPFWVYSLIVTICTILAIIFIIKIGIAGYYEFFNKQSALDRVEKKLDRITKKLGITDEET